MTSFREVFLTGLLIVVIATSPFVQAQGTIMATLTDDTYYGPPYESSHGSEDLLKVGRGTHVTFLKFDISSIPEGAMDITAVLDLYTAHGGVPNPRFVAVFPVDNVTWNEEGYPPEEFLERYFTEKVVQWVTDEETWYEWDVTDIVVKATSESSNVISFAILFDTEQETDPMLFVSKEGSLTNMPTLTVTWASEIPEFPSFIALLLFMTATLLTIAASKRRARDCRKIARI